MTPRSFRPASRRRARLLVALLCGIALAAAARPALAASDYSPGGLGEPSLEEPARLRALGGAGAAERGPRAFSLVNPASVAEVEHLILEGTLLPGLREVDAATGRDESARETVLPSARALVTLPGRVVVGGAYLVGTNARFQVDRPESAGAASTLQIDGSGGIDLIRITLARRVGGWVNLGADYEVIVGSFREDWRRDFADTALATTRDTLETSYGRQGRWRVGAQVHRGGWSAGGVYELARRLPLTFTQRTAGTLVRREHESIRIPSGFAVGATGPVFGRLRAAAQYRRANWSRESLASTLVDFRPLERFSFGLERTGRPEAGSFFDRLPLRVGASFLRWPDLLPLAGSSDITTGSEGVSELVLSLGTGVHSQDRGGAIDVSLEAGRRGDRDLLGISERFLRLGISLQVSDDTWK